MSEGFDFVRLKIPDVILIKPKKNFPDERGFFLESFKSKEFEAEGIPEFVQDNHSRSRKGVIRGLHYQKNPVAIGKLVRVTKGRIFDVAVDMRKGSPYYGKYIGAELSDKNMHMLYVPPGFSHGFLSLEEDTDVIYKMTGLYNPENDRGMLWNDSQVNIRWPLDGIDSPMISKKDSMQPTLAQADNNFVYEK